MPLPITASRGRRLGFAFLYLGANLTFFFYAVYHSILNAPEIRAVKRQLGEPEIYVPWGYDFVSVFMWCVAYLFIFKFEERRDWHVYSAFVLAGFLSAALFHSFWWSAVAAQAVMMTVMLVGHIYFVHYNDRRQA